MKVLVACEFSGRVRDAFIAKGHDAISCDLLPTEKPGPHYQGDVLAFIKHNKFDLMVAHPPCTHLCISGARWWKEKIKNGQHQEGADFFMELVNCGIPKWAIENPIGCMTKKYRKPDQIVQPYWFGDEAQKTTCLWLKGLPLLTPSKMVDRGNIYVDPRGNSHDGEHTLRAKKCYSKNMLLPPSNNRWKIRSLTFQGIADAMADQWGNQIPASLRDGEGKEMGKS